MVNGSWVRFPSGPLVVSGRASDHNCSCAPKTNQSQDPLRKKPNRGFSQGMETLNGREFIASWKSSLNSLYFAQKRAVHIIVDVHRIPFLSVPSANFVLYFNI